MFLIQTTGRYHFCHFHLQISFSFASWGLIMLGIESIFELVSAKWQNEMKVFCTLCARLWNYLPKKKKHSTKLEETSEVAAGHSQTYEESPTMWCEAESCH